MRIEPDPWLAGIFGHPVFRAEAAGGSPPSGRELADAARGGLALFYSRVPVDRVDQVGDLMGIGFRPVDVTVTLEREPGLIDGPAGPAVTIRPAAARDRDRIVRIAGSCFVHSRFHADPLIPKATADSGSCCCPSSESCWSPESTKKDSRTTG